jgi:[ribosomal protein S18]-alanine N-acetyltransferase
MTDAVIRRMRDADIPRIMEIEIACFSTPWSEATFRGLLRRTDCALFVAEADGRVEGYAVFWAVLDQGELGNLAIDPSQRRRKIGTALLDVVIDHAKSHGVRELYLEVRVSNSIARNLYEAYGFTQIGQRRNYYSAPIEDALVLCKMLDAPET